MATGDLAMLSRRDLIGSKQVRANDKSWMSGGVIDSTSAGLEDVHLCVLDRRMNQPIERISCEPFLCDINQMMFGRLMTATLLFSSTS